MGVFCKAPVTMAQSLCVTVSIVYICSYEKVLDRLLKPTMLVFLNGVECSLFQTGRGSSVPHNSLPFWFPSLIVRRPCGNGCKQHTE